MNWLTISDKGDCYLIISKRERDRLREEEREVEKEREKDIEI